jgi:hypothetical protein
VAAQQQPFATPARVVRDLFDFETLSDTNNFSNLFHSALQPLNASSENNKTNKKSTMKNVKLLGAVPNKAQRLKKESYVQFDRMPKWNLS